MAETSDTYDRLTETIYEAALEDPPWHQCLRELMAGFAAQGAVLKLRHPSEMNRGVILLEGFPGLEDREGELGENIYGDRMYAADPFVNLPPNQVVTLDEHVDVAALTDTEFYKLCLEPFDIFHILGVDLQSGAEIDASLRLTRPRNGVAFGRPERELLEALIPHLRRALRLHSRIDHVEAERELYASAVARFSVATLLLDERLQVVSANTRGEELLAENDGFSLNEQRLVLARRNEHNRLRELVNEAIAVRQSGNFVFTRAMPVQRPSNKPPYGLIVRPLPLHHYGDAEGNPVVALFVSDPEAELDATQVAALEKLFGLTPAESRLALQLANGLSLEEATGVLHISRNTGRAHLRSIFSKTAVSQQSQLVRLILNSVANLG